MLNLFKNIIKKSDKKQDDKAESKLDAILDAKTDGKYEVRSESAQMTPQAEPTVHVPPKTDNAAEINKLIAEHPEFRDYYMELSPRYIIKEKIGEGAFSKVFKAWDSKNSEMIAIKIINKSELKVNQLNSILKEIKIMTVIDNENIVKLLNYKNLDRYCFLFMEFLSGGEIFNQILKYTYFSENLSRHILRQLAFAVKYLHDNDIVHRDIKPENLLFEKATFYPRSKIDQLKFKRLSDNFDKIDEGEFIVGEGSGGIGVVKLADFGLSTFSTSNPINTPCGTIGYTSPEQHLNLGYDKKVDMWAIGCVLYTMVVGFPPFYSNNNDQDELTQKVLSGDYTFLKPWFDEVSDECKNLISNLLTVDPQKRYSIDQLINDPWFNIGYETTTKNNLVSEPADDIPNSSIYDKELYKTYSDNIINSHNINDYFTSTMNPQLNTEVVSTPRGEAIKLVFDTVSDVKFHHERRLSITDSISDLDSDYENNPQEFHNDVQEEDSEIDDSKYSNELSDDDSLDSDMDIEEYPVTLTSLKKIKSPKIKKSSRVIESTGANLMTVASHATAVTITSVNTTKAHSIKLPENASTSRKCSISFCINNNKRSGSITSANSSNISHLSGSSISSITSGSVHPDESDEEEKTQDLDSDGACNEDEEDSEWDDKTPLANNSFNTQFLTSLDFKAKCKAHTPYIFKKIPNAPEDVSDTLESKMSEHQIGNLKLDSATILSRRKLKNGT